MTYIEKAKTHPDFMGGHWIHGKCSSSDFTFSVKECYGIHCNKNAISNMLMHCFMYYTLREITQQTKIDSPEYMLNGKFWGTFS